MLYTKIFCKVPFQPDILQLDRHSKLSSESDEQTQSNFYELNPHSTAVDKSYYWKVWKDRIKLLKKVKNENHPRKRRRVDICTWFKYFHSK